MPTSIVQNEKVFSINSVKAFHNSENLDCRHELRGDNRVARSPELPAISCSS